MPYSAASFQLVAFIQLLRNDHKFEISVVDEIIADSQQAHTGCALSVTLVYKFRVLPFFLKNVMPENLTLIF